MASSLKKKRHTPCIIILSFSSRITPSVRIAWVIWHSPLIGGFMLASASLSIDFNKEVTYVVVYNMASLTHAHVLWIIHIKRWISRSDLQQPKVDPLYTWLRWTRVVAIPRHSLKDHVIWFGETISRVEEPYTHARVVGNGIFSLIHWMVCVGCSWFVEAVWWERCQSPPLLKLS